MTTIPEPPQTPGAEPAPRVESGARPAPAFTPSPDAFAPDAPAPGAPVPGALVPGALVPGALVPGALVPGALVPGALVPGALVPGALAHTAPASAPVLDEATYPRLREPKARGALALDGSWHQISPKYVVAEVILRVLGLIIVAVAAIVVTTATRQPWPWIPAALIAVVLLVELAILPRQAKAIGYMLRADDIVFRKGILWLRMIAVPYGRMQLVDITRGPLDRAFGIGKLKLVTAAATTGVEIPGMTEVAAEALRDTLIDVAEMRRTGL